MTYLLIPCPKCRYELRLPDRSYLGRKGRCPQCGLKFFMDQELAVEAPAAGAQHSAERRKGDRPADETGLPPSGAPGETAAEDLQGRVKQITQAGADVTVPSVQDEPASIEGQRAAKRAPAAASPASASNGSRIEPPARVAPPRKSEADTSEDGETLPVVDPSQIVEAPGGVVPGQVGRYRILQELGKGAMGTVYLAHDDQLDRKVALKLPTLGGKHHNARRARFFREARAAAALRHPNICPVYDVGETGGLYYIAMAYIDGRPLTDFIAHRKPQPLRKIAITLRKVAKALQEAHDHGVIHRDLKPDNIMIDHKAEPVVMDFGLARIATEDNQQLTTSGTAVGSPAYMSPQQLDESMGPIGPGSDIFSLGVILYELMTKRRPFRGTLNDVLDQIRLKAPIPPSKLRSDIDPELEGICLKMMAKRIEERYQSMNEVAEAVALYLKRTAGSQGTDSALGSLPAAGADGGP